MVKTREKKVVVAGISREQFEQAFADYAAADARFQNIATKMDMEITRIREKYQDALAGLQAIKEINFETIQVFAAENKADLFAKRKSIETVHGTVGFRTGTPKLKLLKGFTWGAVTNMLREFMPAYLRLTEEPAKDKLLADRDMPEVAKQFAKIGIAVVQDEIFFVEPKKEATE
jgi:phage host-nuclease inhibitor protein Gam